MKHFARQTEIINLLKQNFCLAISSIYRIHNLCIVLYNILNTKSRDYIVDRVYFDQLRFRGAKKSQSAISILSYLKYETYWHSDLVDPLPLACSLSTRVTQTLPERFWEQGSSTTPTAIGNEKDRLIMQAKKMELKNWSSFYSIRITIITIREREFQIYLDI